MAFLTKNTTSTVTSEPISVEIKGQDYTISANTVYLNNTSIDSSGNIIANGYIYLPSLGSSVIPSNKTYKLYTDDIGDLIWQDKNVLVEDDDVTVNSLAVTSLNVSIGNVDYVWPENDGTGIQTLTTDGNGVLTWTDKTSVYNLSDLNDSSITSLAANDILKAQLVDGSLAWVNTNNLSGIAIDNTVIGASTAAAGTFTSLTASSGSISGSLSVGNDITVSDDLTVTGDLSVGSSVTLQDTLTVTGATVLNGGLTMDTNKFTVDDTTGNTSIGGTLNVTGAITVNSEFTLPTTDGSANQVLQTDGSGTVTWGTISSGSSTTINNNSDNRIITGSSTANTLNAESNLTFSSNTLTISASGNLAIGSATILDDTSGTTTLSNIDALDSTTEGTIEAAIDTLSNLTSIGTIATGVWQATDIGVAYGGTGVSSFTANRLLIGNGTSAITTDANLTFSSNTLTIGTSGNLVIGSATILDDTSGTTTLSNIDALDSTTETTIENAIDTLNNLTSASSLATIGTVTTGTWSADTIAVNKGGTGMTSLTSNAILTGNGTSAIQAEGNLLFDSSDLTLYEAVNNGNPTVSIGSGTAETLVVQSVYDSGAQTLDKVTFTTKAASATSDKGKMEFYVDESLIVTLDDGAVNIASGKTYEINGTTVLSNNTLGSNVVNSSLTSVGTLSGLTVSGATVLNGGLTMDTNKFTVADTSGNTVIGGTLAVTGAITVNSEFTLPTTDGSANQVLQTDGSGTVTWGTISSGTSTTINNNADNRIITGSGTSDTLEAESSFTYDSGDLAIYNAVNNGNPTVSVGSGTAETLVVQSVYDSGAQTLDKVTFTTKAASATGDKGKMEFYVDESLIVTLDDGGVIIKDSGTLEIGSTTILSDSSGTTTLSNIDALDATTEATIEAAIDSLSNLTVVGTIATGTWSADTIAVNKGGTGATTLTSNAILTGNGTSAIQAEGNLLFDGSDLTLYEAVNNGNPTVSVGSGTAETLVVQSVYDSGAQTLDKVTFTTLAASASADKGKMEFYVDESLIMTIDDDGVIIKTSGTLEIGSATILSDSSGTTTLSNIDAIDSTTESTLESAIDSLSNLTVVGTIATGTWSADTIAVNKGGTGATSLTSNAILTGNGTSAIQAEGNLLFDGSDLTLYEAVNNGNPTVSIGSGTAETLVVQSVYDSGAQTLDKVTFTTKAASATGDKGKMEFYVDESLIVTLDDGGIIIKDSGTLEIGSTTILSDSSGTTTLSNIDGLDATTEATIEAAIDTLSNLTAASSLVTVGTIGTGVWEGTDIGVQHGGTGVSTLTSNAVLTGNGTSAINSSSDLTFSSNTLSVTGDISITDSTGVALTVQNSTDNASNQVAIFKSGDKTTAANNDEGYITFQNENSAGTQVETSRMSWKATDVTNTAESGQLEFDVISAGTLTNIATISGSGMDIALGTAYQIGSTDVLNSTTLGIGITTSSLTTVGTLGSLTVSGIGGITIGTGGNLTIGTTVVLTGSSLGTGITTSSLTSVGTISSGTWSANTIAVNKGGTGATSHTANQLLYGAGTSAITSSSGLTFSSNTLNVAGDISVVDSSGVALTAQNSTDGASNQVAVFKSGNRTTPADNDEGYISFYNDDSTGTQVEFSRLSWKATDVTNTSKDSQLEFDIMSANTLTTVATIDNGGLNLAVGTAYEINNTSVLNATTLGSSVVNSSLTSLGTLASLTIGSGTLDNFTLPTSRGGTNQILIAGSGGVVTWGVQTGITLDSGSENNLVTVSSGSSSVVGESNLTFNGANFTMSPSGTGSVYDYVPGTSGIGINFNLSLATYKDSITGSGSTGSNVYISKLSAPTIASDTLNITTTNAVTFYISGAPTAGTNMTITNGYALYVGADQSYFGGGLKIPDSNNLIIGTGSDLIVTHSGGNTTMTSTTGNLTIDNTNSSGQTIVQLGADTSGTAFQIKNNTGTYDIFSAGGDGVVTMNGTIYNRTYITAATYTTLLTDHIIGVNRAGVVTVTLIASATAGAGFVYHIKDESGNASTYNITIDGNSSETIDGATTQTINTNYGAISVYSDGTNWFIM